MDYKPIKWPWKEILKDPKAFWKSVLIDVHLVKAQKRQAQANMHNHAAGVLLGILPAKGGELPTDDQLWVVIVSAPVPGQIGKVQLSEWHLWGVENSAPMNDVLSRLPGKAIYMKSIAQMRVEAFQDMMQGLQQKQVILPGDKQWVQ
jgi:hypothetical protein